MNRTQVETLAYEERLTNPSRAFDVDRSNRLYADDIMMTSVPGETAEASRCSWTTRTTDVWTRGDGRRQVIAVDTAFVLDPEQAARPAGEPGQKSIS